MTHMLYVSKYYNRGAFLLFIFFCITDLKKDCHQSLAFNSWWTPIERWKCACNSVESPQHFSGIFPACLSMCYNLMLSVTLSTAQIRAFTECHVSKQLCLSRGWWDFFSFLSFPFFLEGWKCFHMCWCTEIFLLFNTAALYKQKHDVTWIGTPEKRSLKPLLKL